MAHLIDKDAVVAEIDRQRDEALKRQQNLESIGQETVLNEMLANKLNSILSFLNTLEVKEPASNLTWQDIQRIVKVADQIVDEDRGKFMAMEDEDYCKEVLARYVETNKD